MKDRAMYVVAALVIILLGIGFAMEGGYKYFSSFNPNLKGVLPASDAGKVCSDSSQCESYCVTELSGIEAGKLKSGPVYKTGTCYGYKPAVGCHNIVMDGAVTGMVCVN